jgi:hypothetical protein
MKADTCFNSLHGDISTGICCVPNELQISCSKEIEGADLKRIKDTGRIYSTAFILDAWNQYKIEKFLYDLRFSRRRL